jgi:hypothetical protein
VREEIEKLKAEVLGQTADRCGCAPRGCIHCDFDVANEMPDCGRCVFRHLMLKGRCRIQYLLGALIVLHGRRAHDRGADSAESENDATPG